MMRNRKSSRIFFPTSSVNSTWRGWTALRAVGGHGNLTASEERHIYRADVLPKTVRTIWLNDLLRLLRQIAGFSASTFFFMHAQMRTKTPI